MPFYFIPIFLLTCVISIAFTMFFFQILSLKKSIIQREQRIISLYKEKIDKIPAFIEIISKHTAHTDIFLEIIHLHKVAIISNIGSIYDILENNSRLHREFVFLMKVSAHVQDLQRNGNFLYIRDFIMFYESTISKELLFLNSDMERYNRLLQKKDLTLVGLLFPFKKYMKIDF